MRQGEVAATSRQSVSGRLEGPLTSLFFTVDSAITEFVMPLLMSRERGFSSSGLFLLST